MPEVTMIALAWTTFSAAFVQAPVQGAHPPDRPVLAAGTVDYWGAKKEAPQVGRSGPSQEVSVWAEPIRMPDGRFSVYLPPPQVLRFLDDPTPETARGYLQWQKERVSKLRRAMEVLEATASAEDAKESVVAPDAEDRGPSEKTEPIKGSTLDAKLKAPATELIYFRRDGCGYCDRQDPILETVRSRLPEIRLRRVMWGGSPDLWAKYSVTVTPTVVIEADGKPPVVLRGLASEKTILKAIHGRGTDAGK